MHPAGTGRGHRKSGFRTNGRGRSTLFHPVINGLLLKYKMGGLKSLRYLCQTQSVKNQDRCNVFRTNLLAATRKRMRFQNPATTFSAIQFSVIWLKKWAMGGFSTLHLRNLASDFCSRDFLQTTFFRKYLPVSDHPPFIQRPVPVPASLPCVFNKLDNIRRLRVTDIHLD